MYESFRSINKYNISFFALPQFDEGALAASKHNIFFKLFRLGKEGNGFNAI